MATLLTTTFLVMIISSFMSSLEAGGKPGGRVPILKGKYPGSTAMYWGQKGRQELGLSQTCNQLLTSGDIVVISGLTKFGSGREPTLYLSSHCNPDGFPGCVFLSGEIGACQRRGIKVFLSIGGVPDDYYTIYDLKSHREAEELADYLWHSFLGGFSLSRPLGPAVLDGIDFDIQGSGKEGEWKVLAERLSYYGTYDRHALLSAAVQCQIPDPYLDSAVKESLFDYIWVRMFADGSCAYRGDADNLLEAWNKWANTWGVNKLFLGILGESGPGWMTDDVLNNEVLPKVQEYSEYGGVMVWSSNYIWLTSSRANTTTATISSV